MLSPCLGLEIGLGHFLDIDIMTLVLGFGIGLANISVHIYDDAYVLEFDNGKSMYWI